MSVYVPDEFDLLSCQTDAATLPAALTVPPANEPWSEKALQDLIGLFGKSLATRKRSHINLLTKRHAASAACVQPFLLKDYVDEKAFSALYDLRPTLSWPRCQPALRALIDIVWQRCSALSGRGVTAESARLLKLDPELPLSLANVVLVHEDEPMAYNKLVKRGGEKAPYTHEAMQHMRERAALVDGVLSGALLLPSYAAQPRTWKSLFETGLMQKRKHVDDGAKAVKALNRHERRLSSMLIVDRHALPNQPSSLANAMFAKTPLGEAMRTLLGAGMAQLFQMGA